jgi:hypothetical protein
VAAVFFLKLGKDINHDSITGKLPTERGTRYHFHGKFFQSSTHFPVSQDQGATIPAQPKTEMIFEDSAVYIKFSGMDIHMKGDFPCADSLAIDSCLVQRKKLSDFELFCDRIGPYCKGFVRKKDDKGQIIAYFKRNLGVIKPNKDTDLFIKREFSNKVRLH